MLAFTWIAEIEPLNKGTVKVRLMFRIVKLCSAVSLASMLAPLVPLIAVMAP